MSPGRLKEAAFFNVGDLVTFGKYQNKKARIVAFLDDGKGNPLVELEPIPKGKKKNKVIALFKIRHQVNIEKVAARVALDKAIYDAAVAVFEILPEPLRREVESFLHGVYGGKAQPLEAKADELYDFYEPVRVLLRSKHGGAVFLYRGEPKDKPQIKRRFLSWTPSYALATKFAAKKGYEVVEADVRVSDVAAVLVSKNRVYVEYLVKDRPEYHEKGKGLPYVGIVFVSLYEGGFHGYTEEDAALVSKRLEAAIRGAGGKILRMTSDADNEMVKATVELPHDIVLRSDDTVLIGGYLVEALEPLTEKLASKMSKRAKEFSSPAELKEYLHEHPGADPHKHTVKRPDGGSGSGAARTKTKIDKGVANEIGEIWKGKPSGNGVDAVKNMIERGDEVSVNLLGRAVRLLHSEAQKAEGDTKKKLQKLRDKLKGQMHSKEAGTTRNVALRYRLARSV